MIQIKYIYNAEVISQTVKDTGISLDLSDGQVLRAQLLVGCDGRNSKIAQWSNISHVGWNLKTTGTGGRASRIQFETLVALTASADA